MENYHYALEESKKYGLEKVEQYKRFDRRYQNWKGDVKRDIREWKEMQMKKIIGKS